MIFEETAAAKLVQSLAHIHAVYIKTDIFQMPLGPRFYITTEVIVIDSEASCRELHIVKPQQDDKSN